MITANSLVQSRNGVWVGVDDLPSRGQLGGSRKGKALGVYGIGERGQPSEFRAATITEGEERPEARTRVEC